MTLTRAAQRKRRESTLKRCHLLLVQSEMAELPGKTFSIAVQKAGYDGEGRACLTLDEMKKVIALEIYRYHKTAHSMTSFTPLQMWH